MDRDALRKLLTLVSRGERSIEEALGDLADFPTAEMGFAALDMHRSVRRGIPEAVFGPGKTPEQIERIVARMRDSGAPVLVTRIAPEAADRVIGRFPESLYDPVARILTIGALPRAGGRPILVATAGTSDLPVAEEAACTASFLGHEVARAYDVGVAGLHRLAAHREALAGAGAIVAVAGMEGALPGVLAGLVAVPVIGVPTSVGYGVNLAGLTPLFTMLASCACGLTVVNVDNGYGAAVAAHLVLAAGLPGGR